MTQQRIVQLIYLSFATFVFLCLVLLESRRHPAVYPSAESYEPYGLRAVADYLRMNGIPVAVEYRLHPSLGADDVAIFVDHSDFTFFGQSTNSLILNSLRSSVRNGAHLVYLPYDDEIMKAQMGPSSKVTDIADKTKSYQVNLESSIFSRDLVSSPNEDPFSDSDSDEAKSSVLSTHPIFDFLTGSDEEIYAKVQVDGMGSYVLLPSARPYMNRFVQQDDNARLMLAIAKRFLGTNGRVVFIDSSVGNIRSENIFQSLGPWANTAFYQTLALFGVIILTLGTTFGLPIADKIKLLGTRDLMSAVGNLMERAKQFEMAGDYLEDEVSQRVSKLRRGVESPNQAKIDQLLASEGTTEPKGLPKIWNQIFELLKSDEQRMKSQYSARLRGRIKK